MSETKLSEILAANPGVNTSDATATAADILVGKTAYADGEKLTGTATSDANAAPGDILSGKTAYVNGAKVTGNMNAVDTSDATAVASDIRSGKTAYVNNAKITGTLQSQAAQTITPGTANSTIAAGKYLSGAQIIKGDARLVASNIKSGVNIFGVTGTYPGHPFDLYVITDTATPKGVKVTEMSGGNCVISSTEVTLERGSISYFPKWSVYCAIGTTLIGNYIKIDPEHPEFGMVFYAPLHSSSSTASTGQRLTSHGDVTFNNIGGLAAFSNNGDGNYISFPDTGFPSGGSDRTVSCMFRANTIFPETSRIFSYGTQSLTKAMILNTGWNDKFGVEYYGNEVSSNEIQTGRWYHAAVTLSGGTTSVYIDGSFVRSGSETANTVLTGTGCIGCMGEQYYDGAICELKVWTRALSSSEIAAESARCRGLINA